MSKKLARSTSQSVKEGMTVLAILGSFLTDILTPLGAFSGGLAAIGLLLFIVSGSLWAMRRFPDTTENGHIAHSKWSMLVSGGVTIICGGIYGAQLYLADVGSSQLGFLGDHLPIVSDFQKTLTPDSHAQALADVQRGVHATQEAAERAEEAALEASRKSGEAKTQAKEAKIWARRTYEEISYTNSSDNIRNLLREEDAGAGVAAQLIRKYPFEKEISGSAALNILQAFPKDYRRDLTEPLVKAVRPGISAEAYLSFMTPLSSGRHARDVASLINPKVAHKLDWEATKGFWKECFSQHSLQVCRWKAYAIHPTFETLDGDMLVYITKQFVDNGGSGNVLSQLKARGATTNNLDTQQDKALRALLEETREQYPDRYVYDIDNIF